MKWRHTNKSKEDYRDAPTEIQGAFDKQARLLASSLRHPSLRAKKINGTDDIWQARVTRGWRFYFQIVGDTYFIVRIIPHPK